MGNMTALATSMTRMLPEPDPWRNGYFIDGKWCVFETPAQFNWRLVEFLIGINLEPKNG